MQINSSKKMNANKLFELCVSRLVYQYDSTLI